MLPVSDVTTQILLSRDCRSTLRSFDEDAWKLRDKLLSGSPLEIIASTLTLLDCHHVVFLFFLTYEAETQKQRCFSSAVYICSCLLYKLWFLATHFLAVITLNYIRTSLKMNIQNNFGKKQQHFLQSRAWPSQGKHKMHKQKYKELQMFLDWTKRRLWNKDS